MIDTRDERISLDPLTIYLTFINMFLDGFAPSPVTTCKRKGDAKCEKRRAIIAEDVFLFIGY